MFFLIHKLLLCHKTEPWESCLKQDLGQNSNKSEAHVAMNYLLQNEKWEI